MPAEPSQLTSWYSDWSGVSVVVLGLGETGFAIADTLVELGAHTTVLHSAPDHDREVILDVLGVSHRVLSQGEELPSLAEVDLVVVSPEWEGSLGSSSDSGFPGATVWSDVEFAWRVRDKVDGGPQIVLLDQAPKSTLAAEVAERLLLAAGVRAVGAGEGAHPALDAIRLPDGIDVVLWTLSRSQLARMAQDRDSVRRPVLAFSLSDEDPPTHSDLLELYRNTELACIYRRGGGPTERAVEDAWVIDGARAIGVGLDSPGMSDLGRVDEIICDRAFLVDRADRALELCTVDELSRAGWSTPEELEAVIGGFTIARAFSVAPELIGHVVAQWGSGSSS